MLATSALATLLTGHADAVAWEQFALIIAAVVSLTWARRHARPQRPRKRDEPQIIVNGKVCDPGRRSTDLCQDCPLDMRCGRFMHLAQSQVESHARDDALAVELRRRSDELHGFGTVVVVDDQEEVLELVQELLRQVGITTRGATTIAATLPPRSGDTVLLADWNLPDGVARELIEEFRAKDPGMPVIVMSAMDIHPKNLPHDVIWLVKPFDPDFMIFLVRQAQTQVRPIT